MKNLSKRCAAFLENRKFYKKVTWFNSVTKPACINHKSSKEKISSTKVKF